MKYCQNNFLSFVFRVIIDNFISIRGIYRVPQSGYSIKKCITLAVVVGFGMT